MVKKRLIRGAVMAAFLAASGAGGVALAVPEADEPNEPVGESAQALTFDSSGSVTVYGSLGGPHPSGFPDNVDFFSFVAPEGADVDVNIDAGIKLVDGKPAPDSIDTTLYILGAGASGPFTILRVERVSTETDAGSIDLRDPRLAYKVPEGKAGTYYVGVIDASRDVLEGGGVIRRFTCTSHCKGTYTLTISGLTPEVQTINMEIKPGSGAVAAPINPKAKGVIPVALLSSADFNALMVDPESLTFGRMGDEKSWLRCAKDGTDVNNDGRLDLMCHFDNQKAGFQVDTTSARVKGKLKSSGAVGISAASGDGGAFTGEADLKVRGR